jgi:hypothetical protein
MNSQIPHGVVCVADVWNWLVKAKLRTQTCVLKLLRMNSGLLSAV